MNKTQELKERIYAHNPELKELGFGCKVVWKDDEYDLNETILISDSDKYNFYHDNAENYFNADSIREIIGRPIHLEHLLSALKKSGYPITHYRTQEILGIDTFENSKKRYDLTKSFDQNCQNPELVDFLLEVIK